MVTEVRYSHGVFRGDRATDIYNITSSRKVPQQLYINTGQTERGMYNVSSSRMYCAVYGPRNLDDVLVQESVICIARRPH